MSWETRLQQTIERRTGVTITTRGSASLDRLIESRRRQLALPSIDAYVEHLEHGQGGDEVVLLLELLLSGYTYLYRDAAQLEAFAALAAERFATSRRPVMVWSAGCSSGEEVYSLAMVCAAHRVPAAILGTDLLPKAVARAHEAVYSDWSTRKLPERLRRAYLLPDGDRWCVAPALAHTVTVRRHNLLELPLPEPELPGGWDFIFCRNVFIYFSRSAVATVAAHLSQALAPDGTLFVGASESLIGRAADLEPVVIAGQLAYRRSAGHPPALAAPAPVEQPEAPRLTWAPPADEPAATRVTYAAAVSAIERGDHAQAAEVLTALRGETDDPRVLLTLGNLALHGHDFLAALEAYAGAQKLAPLSAEVHTLMGLVYRKLGDLGAAEAALRQALFLEPDFWPAAYLLAGVYERQGRGDRAKQQLRRALQGIDRLGGQPPLRSCTTGLTGVALDAQAVAEACRKQLGA